MAEEKQRVSLKALMDEGLVFAPDIWDCTSVRMAETLGFKALMFSGAAFADSIGLPDIGLITADELVRQVEYVCDYSSLPVIVDADDGYGDSPAVVYRLAKRLIAAGAAAIQIEDSSGIRGYPRYAEALYANREYGTFDAGPKIVERKVWLAKIRACLDACKGTDCFVIARTVSHYSLGLDEAIDRCAEANKIGADVVFVDGIHSLEEARRVAGGVPGYKIYPDISEVEGGHIPTLGEIESCGFNLVTCHFMERASALAMLGFGLHVKKDGSTVYVDNYRIPGIDIEKDFRQWLKTEGDDPNEWMQKEESFFEMARKIH